MNGKLQFLDKRDTNGTLLMVSGRELSYKIAEKSFNEIKNYRAYAILIKHIPEKYVEMYYKRMFYEYSMEISSQIVIHDYDNINKNGKVYKKLLDVGMFPCVRLLKVINQRSDIFYFRSVSYYYGLLKKKIKFSLILFKRFLINLLNSSKFDNSNINDNLNDNIIGIRYGESLDITRRSDIFWLPNSKIEPKNVVIYFVDRGDYKKYLDLSHKGAVHDDEIRLVKSWEWHYKNNHSFESLKFELSALQESDLIEKWLIKSMHNLVSEVKYWISFFVNFNITIHSDSSESGLEVMIKQIAINKIGGLSFGKLRSYTNNRVDFAYAVFPNDIFFVWGIQSAINLKKTMNNIDNILVSGFPYDPKLLKNDEELINIKNALRKKKTKFNLLILDSNHGLNNGWHQDIPTSEMIEFYKLFLKWVAEDHEVGMIIKPKKIEFFNKMPSVSDYFDDISIETGRCHIVKDPFQKMASSYLDDINLVISISFNMPSPLIESISFGNRGVIFDSTNFRYFEKKLYQWGENKVIFSDLNNMLSMAKSFKNNPSDMPEFGDWSSHLNEIDPFHDSKGSIRIGNYLKIIQEGLQKGLTNDEAIINSNRKYSEIWGSDKVISI